MVKLGWLLIGCAACGVAVPFVVGHPAHGYQEGRLPAVRYAMQAKPDKVDVPQEKRVLFILQLFFGVFCFLAVVVWGLVALLRLGYWDRQRVVTWGIAEGEEADTVARDDMSAVVAAAPSSINTGQGVGDRVNGMAVEEEAKANASEVVVVHREDAVALGEDVSIDVELMELSQAVNEVKQAACKTVFETNAWYSKTSSVVKAIKRSLMKDGLWDEELHKRMLFAKKGRSFQ